MPLPPPRNFRGKLKDRAAWLAPSDTGRGKLPMNGMERTSFSDAEISDVARSFKVMDPWRLRDLAAVLRSLPDTASSFRNLSSETVPSLRWLFLYQVEKNPPRRLALLLKPLPGQSPADVFDNVLQRHDTLPKLL